MDDVKTLFSHGVPTPIVYLTTINGKSIYLKQDYLNHHEVSGNKLRKLKYTLLAAQQSGLALLSYGGAFSNHIAALAAAGKYVDISTIGIIRGQELSDENRWGKTLKKAASDGMRLYFVSREAYRNKSQTNPHVEIKTILSKYPDAMIIPEGGSNALSVLGSAEVVKETAQQLEASVIFTACGSGGTMAGFIDGVAQYTPRCRVVGVSVLKQQSALSTTVRSLSQYHQTVAWTLLEDYHFGGYAKQTKKLLDFIMQFESTYAIPLDPIYTAKLCFAVFDQARQSNAHHSENWLIYHSGGLQGRGDFS